MSGGRPETGHALLRWLLSPGWTAAPERMHEAAGGGPRSARLAGAQLLSRMASPMTAMPVDAELAHWLMAGRERIDADLLWLGAWLGADALRRNVAGALCRELVRAFGPERFALVLRRGWRRRVPEPRELDIERLRAFGLAAIDVYLRALSPGLAERFLLDQPPARVARMEAEAWIRGDDACLSTVSDVALWNRQ